MEFILNGKKTNADHLRKMYGHRTVWGLIHDDYFFSVYLEYQHNNFGYRIKDNRRVRKETMKDLRSKLNAFHRVSLNDATLIIVDTSRKDLTIYLD